MSYRTFVSDTARRELGELSESARGKVVRAIDRLELGDFVGSRKLPVANRDVELRMVRVTPRLKVIYAVHAAKELVAVVRLEKQ